MALVLITAPTVEPVSLAEAKAQLRVDIDDDDALISRLITTARMNLEENKTKPRLAMINQTWEYIADSWPCGDTLVLTPCPLQSVTSIKYTDSAGVETTFSNSNYLVDTYSKPGRVRLKSTASWPSVTLRELNGLVVRFVAGHGTSGAAVKEQWRQAILLLVTHWYENREDVQTNGMMVSKLPHGINDLMRDWNVGR